MLEIIVVIIKCSFPALKLRTYLVSLVLLSKDTTHNDGPFLGSTLRLRVLCLQHHKNSHEAMEKRVDIAYLFKEADQLFLAHTATQLT